MDDKVKTALVRALADVTLAGAGDDTVAAIARALDAACDGEWGTVRRVLRHAPLGRDLHHAAQRRDSGAYSVLARAETLCEAAISGATALAQGAHTGYLAAYAQWHLRHALRDTLD